nr:hypothetical protein [Halalkalicoccus jeotgali]
MSESNPPGFDRLSIPVACLCEHHFRRIHSGNEPIENTCRCVLDTDARLDPDLECLKDSIRIRSIASAVIHPRHGLCSYKRW